MTEDDNWLHPLELQHCTRMKHIINVSQFQTYTSTVSLLTIHRDYIEKTACFYVNNF